MRVRGSADAGSDTSNDCLKIYRMRLRDRTLKDPHLHLGDWFIALHVHMISIDKHCIILLPPLGVSIRPTLAAADRKS